MTEHASVLLILFLLAVQPAEGQIRTRTTEPARVSTPDERAPSEGAVSAGRMAEIDVQGHRGARGLLPENTVASVLLALDLSVETVEVDVVVTRDRRVMLSHEPWMSSVICRGPDGERIDGQNERSFNLFEMDYDEIAAFDCGGLGHPDFPEQRPTAARKPLLRELVRIADGYAHVTGRAAPRYNVEIKSTPEHDGVFHPAPDSFARLVYDVLAEEGVLDRTIIQSFDPRAVRAMRAVDSSVTVALLVSNRDGFEANLKRLGFTPDVYSPQYLLVDSSVIEAATAVGVDVIPWTVNEPAEMERLLRLGVRGIITDYPDRARTVVEAFERGFERN